MFEDILRAGPLRMDDKSDKCGMPGYKAHIEQYTYLNSMKTAGLAEASSNFFDQDWKFTSTPGVPINMTAVKNLMERDFNEPVPFPGIILIAADNKTWDPTICRGAWKRATPEELIHAYILAIGRDVRDPQKAKNDKLMRTWRFHILSATFQFLIIPTDEELFWKTNKLRDDMRSQFNAVVRTAIQRVLEIARYKAQKEAKHGKMSSAKIAEA
jgi:hypothetical protein